MLEKIKRQLEPPYFEGDEELTNQACIANTLIIYLGAVLLAVIFIFIPLFAFQKIGSWVISISIFCGLVIGRYLILKGRIQLGGTLIFLICYLCILSMLILSGGTSSTAMFYFATVVLIAGFFMDARVVNGFTIATFLIGTGISSLQERGLIAIPKVFVFNSVFSWIATGVGLLFMTRTRDLFVGNLRYALAHARRENTTRQQVEAILRESEEKFKAQYKGIPIPTYSWQAVEDDLILVDYNDSAFKFTEGRIANLLGKTASVMYRDDPETFNQLIECSRTKAGSKHERWHRLASTGERKYLAIHYAFIPPNLIMVHTEDITERKNTETRNLIIAEVQDFLLHACELADIYQLVSEKVKQLIGDGITATSILDEKRRTLRMGSYHGVDIPFEKILSVIGFDPWQKEFPLDAMAEEDLSVYWKSNLGVLEGGLYALMTRVVPKPACLMIENLLRVQKIYGMGFVHNEAHLGGLVILARSDITPYIAAIEQIVNLATIAIERKRAEEAVQNSEKRFHALIAHGRDEISLLAADGTLLWESPSVHSTLGYSPNQFKGNNIFELMHPDDQAWTSAMYAQILQVPGSIQEGEFRLLHADGKWRWIECTVTNLLDEPSVQAIVVNYHDITAHKRAEETVRESEERYRTLFEQASDGIFYLSTDGKVVAVNESFARMHGYSVEEMQGMNLQDLDTPENVHQIPERMRRIMAGEVIEFEAEHYHKDGHTFPLAVSTGLITVGGQSLIQAFHRDITERKRAEELLQTRMRLMEFADTHTLEELLQKTLDEVELLTQSRIGFYHFVETDQITLSLQAWSTRTKKEFCKAEGKGLHYDIDKAGVWVDCVHQRRPVIHNDYASLPNCKGMPEGHAQVVRELVVPILRNNLVVAILGVGNKPSDYDEKDSSIVTYLADVAWEITNRKRAEEEMALKNKQLTALNQLGQRLSKLAPLPELMTNVSDLIGQVFDNRNLYIALYDEATNFVSFPIYWMEGENRNSLEGRPLSNGLTEFVLRAGVPVLISDHVQESLAERDIALIGTVCQCYLGVPILIDERVIGVIAVQDYERTHVYTDNHVELLSTIASQAAIAIKNARLYQSVQHELSERKRAEEALQQQNQFLIALQNTTLELISQLDLKTLLENIVKRACSLVGTSAGLLDLIDPATNRLIPQVGVGVLEESLQLPVQPGEGLTGTVWQTGEMLVIPDYDQWDGRLDKFSHGTLSSVIGVPLLSDARVLGVLVTGSPHGSPHHFDSAAIEILNQFARLATVAVQNARLFSNLQSELNERRRAEQALRESEYKFRSMVEQSSEGVVLIDEQNRIIEWNPAQEKITGITIAEAINKPYWEVQYRILPPERQAQRSPEYFKNVMEAALANGQIPQSASSSEIGIQTPAGERKSILQVSFPIRTENGYRIGAVVRDITERKRVEEDIRQLNASLEQRVEERTRELRDAQEQIVRQEKLAVLGQLAGGMGHELRNPLGVISNAVYFLKLVLPDAGDKIKEYLDLIEREIHTSEKIVTDLLDFARVESAQRASVPVSELVRQTLERFPAPASVDMSLNLPADLPFVFADPKHVVQILGNLAVNAYQSMASTRLRRSTDPVENRKFTISASLQDAMIAIAVRDTGAGISPENIQKIFEPQFLIEAKGIGLEMAISKKLAEANGGRIEAQSEAGKGSTFTLWLPASQEMD